MKFEMALLAVCLVLSVGAGEGAEKKTNWHLSHIAIGDAPANLKVFATTDCELEKLFDCSAKDADGVVYVFFDGVLSKVSLSREEAREGAVLPAGISFNEKIENSIERAEKFFGKKFVIKKINHVVVATSAMENKSAGVQYWLELRGDICGRLQEVVERSDF